jgi:hypothetical protein
VDKYSWKAPQQRSKYRRRGIAFALKAHSLTVGEALGYRQRTRERANS